MLIIFFSFTKIFHTVTISFKFQSLMPVWNTSWKLRSTKRQKLSETQRVQPGPWIPIPLLQLPRCRWLQQGIRMEEQQSRPVCPATPLMCRSTASLGPGPTLVGRRRLTSKCFRPAEDGFQMPPGTTSTLRGKAGGRGRWRKVD